MSPSLRTLLPLALFVSGAASLVVEVAWSRALSLSLGNSHHAVATVVGSMMTGLCLGSLAASRALPRIRRLSRAYGLLEMGIGICAGLTPLAFALLPALLAPLYALPGPLFATLRFLLVFGILLPPTAGMGATLPVLTATLSRGSDPGVPARVGGKLYGLNTLGAFTGTILAGFVLLPRLGLLRTTLGGAALSFAVGLAVYLLAGEVVTPAGSGTQEAKTRSAADTAAGLILPLYAVSGALAMVYEITWTRVLTPLAGTSVYSFTLILGALLAGIGAGSLVLSTRWGARVDPAQGFVTGQLLVGSCAFASTWGLQAFPELMRWVVAGADDAPAGFWVRLFLLFAAVVLLPAFLLGGLFPFAARLLGSREREAGAEVGRVYAWNTAGSLAGSLLAGFVLVTALGSERTLVYASAASAALALAALPLAGARPFRLAAAPVGAIALVAFPLLVPRWDLYEMTSGITQTLRRQPPPEESAVAAPTRLSADAVRVAFHREGATSTVTVLREKQHTFLRIDGKVDASTLPTDMLTQVLVGHLPFFFARDPGEVFVIGYGSGVTTRAVLTHPVRLVETIEIERAVIDAAPFFDNVASRPLEDPRSRLLVEDARTALSIRPRSYDVIISEPSNPWMAGVNNLFTAEFYRLVRKRLNPGGVFCQWVQAYEMSGDSLHTILDTLATEFPESHLFSSQLGTDMLIVASPAPLALAPGASLLFPDRPEASRDLARVGIRSFEELVLRYTAPLPTPAPGVLLNTDDNSWIQYRAPLEVLGLVTGTGASRRIPASSESILRLFYPGKGMEEVFPELARAAARIGAPRTAEAIARMLEDRGHGAAARAALGRPAHPEDSSDPPPVLPQSRDPGDLLGFAEKRIEAGDVSGAVAALERAETLGLRGADQLSRAGFVLLQARRFADAEKRLDVAASDAASASRYRSLAGRGAARYRLGRREEGLRDVASAKSLRPDDPLPYLLLALAYRDVEDAAAARREAEEGLRRSPGDARLIRLLESLPAAR